MMATALISVIVPVYNGAKHLEKCLTSIINQTYSFLEIIVVDDASIDESVALIEKMALKDSRIKLIKHAYNQKQGTARNSGIIQAQGAYLMFCDADDVLVLDAIELLYERMCASKADIVLGRMALLENSSIIPTPYIERYFQEYVQQQLTNIRAHPVSLWFVSSCVNQLYDAQFIKENKLLFPQEMFFEDVLFCIQAHQLAQNIVFCPYIVYLRQKRQPDDVLSTTACYDLEKFKDRQKLEQKIFDFYQQLPVTATEKNKHLKFFLQKVYDTTLSMQANMKQDQALQIKQWLSDYQAFHQRLMSKKVG